MPCNMSPMQASLFHYAKTIAEAQSGEPVFDCVVAVPAFFGQAQRRALVDSANLAGLKVGFGLSTRTLLADHPLPRGPAMLLDSFT